MAAADSGRPVRVQRGGSLVPRIVSGIVLALLALFSIVAGGWVFATILAVAMGIVHLEWAKLSDGSPWPTAVFTAGLTVAIAMVTLGFTVGALMIVALGIVTSALTLSVWRPAGVLYAATFGIGVLLLRLSPSDGLVAVLLVVLVVASTDTAAYFVGKAIGGAKLWPAVSPGKTWAGAIGGLVGSAIVGTAGAAAMGISPTVPLVLVIAGLSITSQAGDLFESWVKRCFGAKDSGTLIPGHGGLMDRVDGLIFAIGFALLVGWLHAGPEIAAGLVRW